MKATWLIVVCGLLGASLAAPEPAATVQTDPVPHSGDAADDPAIWVHPTDRSKSLVIGTDKRGGLAVYDLAGKQVQYLPCGRPNNVDVRYDFPLDGKRVDIVAAGERERNLILVWRVDAETGRLVDISGDRIKSRIDLYGCCLTRSARTGKFHFIGCAKDGKVEQQELFDDGAGTLAARIVRRFDVGGTCEGCVVDDELGRLYIGEENKGVWRYAAEPDAGETRTAVDLVSVGRLKSDVEGLAIRHGPDGTGFLIVSSQGSSDFVVYRREGENAYVGRFRIADGNGIDAVGGTDGIEATSAALGPAFPHGLFIAQDDSNGSRNQNFKLVPWESIARSFEPALPIEAKWDPRAPTKPLK